MIRVISFDLDDTLWPVRPVIERAERAQWRWIAEQHPEVAAIADEATVKRIRKAVWNELTEKRHDLTHIRLECLQRIGELGRLADVQQFARQAFDAFEVERNRVCFFADALPALRRLANHFDLVAVTNGNACLARTGIDGWFAARVNAREAGAAKPDRRIFDLAAERLGAPPQMVLHIGDDPVLDVEGARLAGQQAVWLNRTGAAWPQDIEPPKLAVSSLASLDAPLLRKVFG